MSKHRLDPGRASPRRRASPGGRRRASRPGDGTRRVLVVAGLAMAALIAVPIATPAEFGTARDPAHVEAPPTTRPSVASSPSPESTPAAEAPATEVRRSQPTAPATSKDEPIPEGGPGTFRVAPAHPADDRGAITYRVEVEHRLPFAPAAIARFVEQTLSDERGWSAAGHRLVRVEHSADLRILLATPETAAGLCAPLDTEGRLSCRHGKNVVLNAWRWQNGATAYDDALIAYRRYVINHETGHALGYPHGTCSGAGQPAPVMLQQTLGLGGCRPNPWPTGDDVVALH